MAVNGNQGCGVQTNKASNYGPALNSVGGGFYAMERTSDFIRVFFWARNDGSVPAEVANGGSSINTDTWVRILFLTYLSQLGSISD